MRRIPQRSFRTFRGRGAASLGLSLAACLGAALGASCAGPSGSAAASGSPAAAAVAASSSPARAAAAGPTCRLAPIHAGICALGADHVLGDDHDAGERIPFALLAFLVEDPEGEKALVDLGPMTLEYTNAMFRRYGFFRDLGEDVPEDRRHPDDIVQPRGNVFRQLEARGIAPSEIGHIVLTHLHADHHGMDDAKDGGAAERFPNAVLHASRIGWEENLARRVDGRWGSYVDFAFGDFLLRREREGKVRFADDAEVFPGLRTLHLGGHAPCSQAVVVETGDGPAIITSDEVYGYDLLERAVLPRLHTTPARYREAVELLVALAESTGGILIPVHDPAVWEAYAEHGAGWLAALRPRSERAVRGYREAGGIPEK